MAKMRRPLEGVKCICVTMFQQGPVAFSHFADLGAEVIKIERPGTGEQGRYLLKSSNFPISPYYETNNRGVKCITLNIQHDKSKEIIYKLVKDADIFAQNFRPGVAERRGFGYEVLSKINPKLVYLSMTSYGPDGPNANLPGTDGVAQATGGIGSVFGEEGSRMVLGQASVADETAAMTNFAAAMVGLYHAKMTGEGQLIETSLLGGMVRLMGYSLSRVMMTGEVMEPTRARIMGGAVSAMTACFSDKDDKPFMIQVIGEERWQKGLKGIGFYDEMVKVGCDKLGAIADSKEKTKVFFDTIDRLFATGTREDWLKKLRAADVVSAPINTLNEVAEDLDVIANEYITVVDHPKAGKVREVGFPWKFSKTPAKAGIAPELGEHTNEVLKGIGYSDAEIEQLRNEKVI